MHISENSQFTQKKIKKVEFEKFNFFPLISLTLIPRKGSVKTSLVSKRGPQIFTSSGGLFHECVPGRRYTDHAVNFQLLGERREHEATFCADLAACVIFGVLASKSRAVWSGIPVNKQVLQLKGSRFVCCAILLEESCQTEDVPTEQTSQGSHNGYPTEVNGQVLGFFCFACLCILSLMKSTFAYKHIEETSGLKSREDF